MLAFALAALGGVVACESSVDRRTRESGLEMEAQLTGNAWMITFFGIRGYASNVVVRFGDGREETFRRPMFQLPPDIEGPIDIWLLEYELRGETVRGPYRFHFDPQQAQIDNAKDALDMLGNDWFAWSRTGGKDVIYTSFVSRYTCGLARVEYGFGEEPDLELPLPPCKMSGIDFMAGEMLEFPVDTHAHVVVRITYADGEQTSVHRIANPKYRSGATGAVTFNRALVISDLKARLLLDGGYRCDTPCEVKVPVDGQSHELRLEKEGYQAQVKSWTPKSVAEPTPLFGPMKLATPRAVSTPQESVEAAATPEPALGGAVSMEVTPSDARVVVDGRPVEGESPFVVTDLRVGKHAVTLKKDGYEMLQAEFELSTGSMHMRFKLDAEGTEGPLEGR